MNYWLVKSEPDCFSIDDLKVSKIEPWDGVRNYQARNFLMEMKKGDFVFFYHSNTKIPGIVGLATVHKEHYPDHTAWEKDSEHPDPKSTPENPRWFMPDLKYKKKYKNILSLEEIKKDEKLTTMKIAQRGNRLSVTPVSKKEFDYIETLLTKK